MSKNIQVSGLLLLLLFGSCNREAGNDHVSPGKPDSLTAHTGQHEIIIANPIVYDVIIQNLDKEDTWKEQSIENLDRQLLVEQYFSAVYNNELKAYDFFTGKAISKKTLTKFEESLDFDRTKVGKIQFYEQWYLDTLTHTLRKQVTKMVFGYHKLTADSQLVGYKPVFGISFQP